MFNFSFRCIRNTEWWCGVGIDVPACSMGHVYTKNALPLRRELVRIDLAQAELEN